jgi:hypothetical protein
MGENVNLIAWKQAFICYLPHLHSVSCLYRSSKVCRDSHRPIRACSAPRGSLFNTPTLPPPLSRSESALLPPTDMRSCPSAVTQHMCMFVMWRGMHTVGLLHIPRSEVLHPASLLFHRLRFTVSPKLPRPVMMAGWATGLRFRHRSIPACRIAGIPRG